MEAKSSPAIPDDEGGWQYEPKWDGFRCLVYKEGTAVELRAKSGKPLGRYFPEVVEFFLPLESPRFVFDGELLIDGGGNTFGALQVAKAKPIDCRRRE
ncbi:MAG: ATP-dependent DNA ligase [Rhizobiaceae bacterium]